MKRGEMTVIQRVKNIINRVVVGYYVELDISWILFGVGHYLWLDIISEAYVLSAS